MNEATLPPLRHQRDDSLQSVAFPVETTAPVQWLNESFVQGGSE